MTHRLAGAAGLWVLASTVVLGADFWETKPFTDWSDKELQQLVSDSPWARTITVVLSAPGGGRSALPATLQRLKLTVSWRSSLPMKQALVRNQVGLDQPIPAESQLLLERRDDFYLVSLSGLPLSYSRATGTLRTETFLRRDHLPPIPPSSTIIQPVKDTLMLVFAFPRTDPITVRDKDVEFVTKIEQIVIRKKFDVKRMVFHGELEL